MIRKEWHCEGCGSDFESAIPLCKKCGHQATRAFRTPVGISKGLAKRFDAALARNFAKRGVSNFTNRDGTSKVDWASGPSTHPRAFGENDWRSGGWGKEHLSKLNQQFGSSFVAPALRGPKQLDISEKAALPALTQPWQRLVDTEVINQRGS